MKLLAFTILLTTAFGWSAAASCDFPAPADEATYEYAKPGDRNFDEREIGVGSCVFGSPFRESPYSLSGAYNDGHDDWYARDEDGHDHAAPSHGSEFGYSNGHSEDVDDEARYGGRDAIARCYLGPGLDVELEEPCLI